jgi:predicted N-acetyltransferase YhbS
MLTSVSQTLAEPRISLHLEAASDVAARERLLDSAFGAARFEKTCERLRAGRIHADGLSFVLKDRAKIVGTIRLWKVMAGGVPALLLGPLAIATSHEGLGLGSMLMRHALKESARLGHKAIVLVGDAPYYERFGFSAEATENLVLPGPVDRERFLALELVEGALNEAMGLVIATGERVAFSKASQSPDQSTRKALSLP